MNLGAGMNLGFVGVGPWAQKLAAAFRECGAEITCFDRATPSHRTHDKPTPEIFGQRVPWQEMLADPQYCEAIIACAPPEVTTEVAMACAKAGKRCVATKPLMLTDSCALFPDHVPGRTPSDEMRRDFAKDLYVDLWRLYSPAWLALKEELRGKRIDSVRVDFCGNGPFRSFPGVLDYGPHALAFVFDLLGTDIVGLATQDPQPQEADRGQLLLAHASAGSAEVVLRIGNGATVPKRQVSVKADGGEYFWSEPHQPDCPEELRDHYSMGRDPLVTSGIKHALRRFCRAFMAGEASRTLEYSIAAQRVLEKLV